MHAIRAPGHAHNPRMELATGAAIDSPSVWRAGRDVLSLALMDARNHSLQLLGRFEQALGPTLAAPADAVSPLWVVGHVGWLAEYWIARNPRRGQGAACPADTVHLASIEPQADSCFNPLLVPPPLRCDVQGLEVSAVRAYLLETLETTLELLLTTQEDDDGLYFFRMALWHEDMRCEQLAVLGQTLGVPLGLPLPPGLAAREPLVLPAGTWQLGASGAGFVPGIEQGRETVQIPAFDIDAQPVGWAQFVEFIDDGGYDAQDLWQPAGWQWLQREAQAQGRRGPRHVEQIGVASGAVLQNIFGKPTRMGGLQSAMHVSWWEADAYARWAGRRLPTEAEWEMAAQAAGRRGFRWGDVHEWTAGTLRAWAGAPQDPWAQHADADPAPALGKARVLRGASFAQRARMKRMQGRQWALPEDDSGFTGFRTCAV